MLQNLCAIQWTDYLLDGVLALILFGYVLYCARRGFIDCFFGFFSTAVALIAAIALAKGLGNATGGLFGLDKALDKAFTNAFMDVEGFDTHVVGESTAEMLKDKKMSTVFVQLVLKATKGAQDGTILADALGDVTASLATTILCGVVIFIAVKVLVRLLKGVLEGVAKRLKIVGAANTLLGAVVGFVGFTLLLSFVLTLFSLLPFESINNALDRSVLVGFVYKYNPVMELLGLLV